MNQPRFCPESPARGCPQPAVAPVPQVGRKRVSSIITKSKLLGVDFAANPYVGCTHACRYCYASFMRDFGEYAAPWGSFIVAKEWPELSHVYKYEGKSIFLGSVTDPYVPEEEQLQRTRALLLELQGSGAFITITTKSDLVLRDLELIRSFPQSQVLWSINTLDEGFRAQMDKAVSIERRLRAMAIFHEAGVQTGCFIAPIFPALTNVPAIIEAVRAHANVVLLDTLNLRGPYRDTILGFIYHTYPQLWPLYSQIYQRGDRSYWQQLSTQVREYAANIGLEYATQNYSRGRLHSAPPLIVNFFDEHHIDPPPDSTAPARYDAPEADDFCDLPLFRG